MYLFALLLAVAGSVLYHLSIKQVPQDLNPFFALAASYGVAFLICLAGLAFWPAGSRSPADLNWGSLGVALGIAGIEVGFLLAYRAGWHIGLAALSANTLATLILLPIGIVLFKDTLTLQKLAGVVLCSSGLWFLTRP